METNTKKHNLIMKSIIKSAYHLQRMSVLGHALE